ncbi:MAG: hypothetical protein AB4050_02865 [Synechococcus sp.]
MRIDDIPHSKPAKLTGPAMPIQKADPELRRTVLLGLVGVAVLGYVARQWGLPRVMEAISDQAPAQAVRSLQAMAILAFAPMLPIAYCIHKLARRVKTSQRFPPPGMAVIRDTKILTGETAKHLGSKLMAFSLTFASVALFGAVYLTHTIAQLGQE